MGVRAGSNPPKILATIELYHTHTEAVLAELTPAGIRWDSIGEVHTWDEVISLLSCAPPWGPLSRALNPKEWVWSLPGYDELVTMLELLATGNVQRGNASGAKRSDFPKRIKRPYDERDIVDEKKIGRAEDARVTVSIIDEHTGADFASVLTR